MSFQRDPKCEEFDARIAALTEAGDNEGLIKVLDEAMEYAFQRTLATLDQIDPKRRPKFVRYLKTMYPDDLAKRIEERFPELH